MIKRPRIWRARTACGNPASVGLVAGIVRFVVTVSNYVSFTKGRWRPENSGQQGMNSLPL